MHASRFSRHVLLLLAAWATSGVVFAEDDTRTRIANIERQLADLQKQLDALKKPAAGAAAAKKPLTLAEAEIWRSIRGVALSNDGKWFAHRVGPAEGDGEVILRSVADGKETKFPGGGGFGMLAFSFDSKWFGYTATPFVKRGSTAPPAARPKPKVVLVNLATAEKSEIEGAAAFQFSGEAGTHIAYRKSGEAAAPPTGPVGPPAPGAPPPAQGPRGSDLVLRELATGNDLVIGNVAEFGFDKKGTLLAMVIDAQGQIGNGVHLRDMKTGAVTSIETGKASYRNLTWNRDALAFTLLKGVEDKALESPWYSVLGFTQLDSKPVKVAYDPKEDKSFPAGMGVSTNRPVQWTDDLSAFTFGFSEAKKKPSTGKDTPPARDPAKKDEPKSAGPPSPAKSADSPSTDPKPDLAIWHWKDERLQPMQEKQAASDRSFTHLAVYRVKDKKFVRLSDDECKSVTPAPKQKYAIGQDLRPYQYMSTLDGRRYADVYVIDMSTGERKKALAKAPWFFGPSPTGTQFLYYDNGHYFAYDMAAGKSVNLTEKLSGASFVDADDDHNVAKPPTRPVGWSRDGKTVLLSDGWDIWKVAADGSGGENLTVNGKSDGIRYQGFTQFDPDRTEPGFDLTQPAYTRRYGEWTKKSCLARIDPGKPGVTVLVTGDCSYGFPMKARNADLFAVSKETNQEYGDYYLTDGAFKSLKKVTDANPQQANYQWSAGAKLIEYKGVGGKRLQGSLFLPANYEPGKKYPTIVYIYEKLSDGLHRYTPPSNGGGFNKSIYTSNGYAVLMPDIAYRLNDPGLSAVECVLPALDAAVATGVVDPDKVGLQGHSWGGYQTAFLVTQTPRFKAAIAGAPLTDLVSMYSSVYWNTGSANQPIFESSQGRFTAGYWDQQEAYIRNSPVYHATKVQTPLVILHNDKDGAVDFTQGVEYYNTLRRLQKPVVMLQYRGENHGLSKPENQKDYAVRMREFFDHQLMGKPAPDWWADGVPHLKMEDHLKARKP